MDCFVESQDIFFREKKYGKGFMVLCDSNYWYLFLSKMYTFDRPFEPKVNALIVSGLEYSCSYLLRAFSNYIISNNLLNGIPSPSIFIKNILSDEKIYLQKYKLDSFFENKHNSYHHF